MERNIVNSLPEGKEVKVTADSSQYRSRIAAVPSAQNMEYHGDLRDGKRHGFGIQRWSDGSTYEGNFANDMRHGFGKHVWPSGECYEGEFVQDRREGRGRYTWPSGATFTGSFREDKRDGHGIYVSAQEETFEGMYKDDIRHGEGTMTYVNRRQDVGMWRGSKLIQLKFALPEASSPLYSDSYTLYTPDLKSRGNHLPKGPLEMASQELILSACQGNLDRMASLVHSGLVYVDVVDRMGVSALFAASIHGHVELVDFLLNEGADVNRVATSQYTPLSACYHLHYKAQVGHTKYHLYDLRSGAETSLDASEYTIDSSDLGYTVSGTPFEFDSQQNTPMTISPSGIMSNFVSTCTDFNSSISSVSASPLSSLMANRLRGFHSPVPLRRERSNSGSTTRSSLSPQLHHTSATPPSKRFLQRERVINGEINQAVIHPSSLAKFCWVEKDKPDPKSWGDKEESTTLPTIQATRQVLQQHFPNQKLRSLSKELIKQASRLTSSHSDPELPQMNRRVDVRDFERTSGHPSIPSAPPSTLKESSGLLEEEESVISLSLDEQPESQTWGGHHMRYSFNSSSFGSVVSAAQSTVILCDSDNCDDDGKSSTPFITEHKLEIGDTKFITRNTGAMIDRLLSRGADANICTYPLPPVHYATLAGDNEGLTRLQSKGAALDLCLPAGKGGYSPLHLAIAVGKPRVLEHLLTIGALPDTFTNTRNEGCAIAPTKSLEKVKNQKVRSSLEGLEGWTPLHCACSLKGNLDSSIASEVVSILLRHGADPNVVAQDHSPLSLAIVHNLNKVIDILLDGGADPGLCLGRTVGSALCSLVTPEALHHRSCTDTINMINKLKCYGAQVSQLVDSGDDVGRCIGTVIDWAYQQLSNKRKHVMSFPPVSGMTVKSGHTKIQIIKFLIQHLVVLLKTEAVGQTEASKATEKVSYKPSLLVSYPSGHLQESRFDPQKKPKKSIKFAVIGLSQSCSLPQPKECSIGTETQLEKDSCQLMIYQFCYSCGRYVHSSPLPCQMCKIIFYCSNKCKLKHLESGHYLECKGISSSEKKAIKMAKEEKSSESHRRQAIRKNKGTIKFAPNSFQLPVQLHTKIRPKFY